MKVRLGDVCEVISGSTPKTSIPEYWNGTLKWITPAEIGKECYVFDSERHISEEGAKSANLRPLPPGTVILSSRAPIGKTAIAGCELYCNQGFKNLVCSSVLVPEYLYYFLSYNTQRLNLLGRGATFKELSKSIVENIEIPLINLTQQRHIVHILQNTDRLIIKYSNAYSTLDKIVKSRFMEMFGDITNNTKWKLRKISEVAQVYVGVVVKPAQYYAASGIPAFRSQNIGEMQVKNNEWVYFTNDGNNKNRKSIVQEHDVLVVRSGAPGTACVVDSQHAGYNAIDIIIARPDTSLINSVFLAAITNSHTVKKQIITATNGVAQKHFNVTQYKSLTIPLPPLPLQQQFAAFVEKVDKSKLAVKQSLEKLETLKKSLMQQYFG